MAPPEIVIRRLEMADAEAYRQIRLAGLEKAPDAFGALHAEEAARPLAHFAQRLASSVVLGAFAGPDIVGVMDYKREERPVERHKAVVHGVYVEKTWRRHGVADQLLGALIEQARTEVEQLSLTTSAWNAPAIALYERFGFVAYGIEPRARKGPEGYSDNVLMALRLRDE